MLDKLITYVVILVHTTGSTWYKVLYYLYVMGKKSYYLCLLAAMIIIFLYHFNINAYAITNSGYPIKVGHVTFTTVNSLYVTI